MTKTDAVDKALAFIDKTNRLGQQLSRAREQQRLYLAALQEMYKNGEEHTPEYADLEARSHDLQRMIDKWAPVYRDRLRSLEQASGKSRRRR